MKIKVKQLDAYSFCPMYEEAIRDLKPVRPFTLINGEEHLTSDQAKIRKFLLTILSYKSDDIKEISNQNVISIWQRIYLGSDALAPAEKKYITAYLLPLTVLKDHVFSLEAKPILVNPNYDFHVTEHDTIEGNAEAISVSPDGVAELLILSFQDNILSNYKAICAYFGLQKIYDVEIKRIRFIIFDIPNKSILERVLYPDKKYLETCKTSLLSLLDSIKRGSKYYNSSGSKNCPLGKECKCRV